MYLKPQIVARLLSREMELVLRQCNLTLVKQGEGVRGLTDVSILQCRSEILRRRGMESVR